MEKRSERVILLYATTGNDLNYNVPAYIIQNSGFFEKFSFAFTLCGFEAAHDAALDDLARGPYDFDYVHIMDSDVVPAFDTTKRLVSHGLDVVVSPVWMYDATCNDIHLNATIHPEMLREKKIGSGLQKIYTSSFSSIVIHRRVLQAFAMADEPFCKMSPMVEGKCTAGKRPDCIFFARLAEMGFEAWVDWDCGDATHFRYVSLNQDAIDKLMITYGKNGTVDPRFYPDHPAMRMLEARAPHVAKTIKSNWKESAVISPGGKTFREVLAGIT